MATYKNVDVDQLEADLTAVADAIRAKTGATDKMSFPDGFVSAVENSGSGGDPVLQPGAFIYYRGTAFSTFELDFESSASGSLT